MLRVAELAQLDLREDEQQEMLRDLNAILGHVAQLNELDTREVPPMTQVNAVMPIDHRSTQGTVAIRRRAARGFGASLARSRQGDGDGAGNHWRLR